jgi:hypothetical protein
MVSERYARDVRDSNNRETNEAREKERERERERETHTHRLTIKQILSSVA